MAPKIIVEIIEEYKGKASVKEILQLFGVSKSSYYRWKNKGLKDKCELSFNEELVINLCKDNKYRYGYRKITALARKDRVINKNTVQRIMQKFECQCKVKVKRNKKYMFQSVVRDNKLNRDFKANRPLEKLVTDITYIPYGSSMLYLSTIMDLYNGEIIASTLSPTQNLKCVLDTLNQLPRLTKPCVLHSDQGSVYTSREYQKHVQNKSIIMSMSRKGTPADNAPIESFHASLKCETFELEPELKSSNEIVSQTVINYIKYYNEIRIQEKLGYLSPKEFRRQNLT